MAAKLGHKIQHASVVSTPRHDTIHQRLSEVERDTCNLYRVHTRDCEEGHGDEQVGGPVDGRHHRHRLPSHTGGEDLAEDDVGHWRGEERREGRE